MKSYIKIEIDTASATEAEIFIAELSENEFYAFEQSENGLIAYIKAADINDGALQAILPEGIEYKCSVIEDRNWNEEWESRLQPVIINNFAGIRASFHAPLENVEHEIIITPKMSFGTGHHATTFLMVEQMRKINFKNKTVLDFGTGTGILAILAEKLGAAKITAIDNDDWSINNTLENIAANNCKRINLEKRNNIEGLSVVNVILANINYTVLTQNAKMLSMLLQPNSILIISGFLLKDEVAVATAFVKNQFLQKERDEKNGWVSMVLEKC
ncbi:MAG: 50S ribosomal protein L11 methyltransferase [Ginsengibacter sp.]